MRSGLFSLFLKSCSIPQGIKKEAKSFLKRRVQRALADRLGFLTKEEAERMMQAHQHSKRTTSTDTSSNKSNGTV